jgi:hypothetical protein
MPTLVATGAATLLPMNSTPTRVPTATLANRSPGVQTRNFSRSGGTPT